MFEGLSDKLSNILSTLTRRGALTEEDAVSYTHLTLPTKA